VSVPFAIKAVRWATAGFPTDRGTMTMPAWVFDIAEIDAYLAYAALDPSSFFGGGVRMTSSSGVRVSADGLTLRIPVSNAGPGKCDFSYTAATAESATAVSFAVRQYSHASPGEQVICALPLSISYVDAPLSASLGGRVVVDAQGDVAAVCPDFGDC
jgi:hypothetical protein